MSIEVVKIGSSSVFADGSPLYGVANGLAAQIVARKQWGIETVLVSSGAIAFGRNALQESFSTQKSIPDQQALASVGQRHLLNFWSGVLDNYNLQVGQILTTNQVLQNPDGSPARNINATVQGLFRREVLPIFNENDAVATDEITQGDNDNMSALLANAIEAKTLYLLGTSQHIHDDRSKRIELARIGGDFEMLEKVCQGTDDPQGTGGAVTKLAAAKTFLGNENGVKNKRVIVANAAQEDVLSLADMRKVGTTIVK